MNNKEQNAILSIPHSDNGNAKQLLSAEAAEYILAYRELRLKYVCALKEIKTKFEVLNTEFRVSNARNPISSITARIKTTSGIIDKLHRKNLDVSIANMEKNIQDIAGIRVICSYIDDIYLLANALKNQADITVITEKDYIKNPKPNGYRSLHLIVSVPVFFSDKTENICVEIQIRTIAMDFWASLEHQMKYKQSIPNAEAINARLAKCAEVICKTDEEMLDIRKTIEATDQNTSEEELLKRKMKNIDAPFEEW